MRILGAKKKLASILQVEKKSQRKENFIEKRNYRTRTSFISSYIITYSFISTY